jgi:hypothetical protein
VFSATQTDANGTFTDTKSALKDTVVVAPVIVAPTANALTAANPVLRGTSEPGATVSVREGLVVVCTAIADAQGAWSCVSRLALGARSVTATQTDVAGNVSPASAPTSFTVVVNLPAVTITPTPINARNAGAYVATGNCTTLAGTVTVTVGTVTAMASCINGMYSATLVVTAVPDGQAIRISAFQTNPAGTAGDERDVAKDTVAPAAPWH